MMEERAEDIKLEAGDAYPTNLLVLDTLDASSEVSNSNSGVHTFQSISSKQRWNESPEARARRLARNAERMRERRAKESEDEYRARLARNAEANRIRRQNESEMERAMRLVRNAARQRLRRAMETPDQRAKRLAKLAERMRIYRANETPEQRKERLAEMAARARERIARETSEERKERLRKLSEYAKKVRSNKDNLKKSGLVISNDRSDDQMISEHENAQIKGERENDHVQPQAQHESQAYAAQSLTNSIEYYQNMFMNSALRSNGNKEPQVEIQTGISSPQNMRFMQNNQNIPIYPNANSNIFQQNIFDDVKSVQKYQPPYQTLTSSIEYYQNKYIKQEKLNQQTNDSNKMSSSQATYEKRNAAAEEKTKKMDGNFSTIQQIQNTATPLYNQLSYLNNFNTSTTTSASSQQNYYPPYHNSFQLTITSNSVPPPFTPAHLQNSNIQMQNNPYAVLNTTQNQQLMQDFPKPVRGRPRKIFADNEITRIPAELQEEAIRQHKVNTLLENEINQMLASPKRKRGRPKREHETDDERQKRLQRVAEHQRRVRANETPEERAIRLKNLSERARLKRQQLRDTETEEQRRERRAKQAEYARRRRLKAQAPETKKRMEERARELYAQLHNLPLTNQLTNNGQLMTSSPGVPTPDEFVKNPGRDFSQSENNDVLKILEPIIVMKAK